MSPSGIPQRNVEEHSYQFHYRIEIFYTIIDLHLEELKGCFNETNIELLMSMAYLSPCDGFCAFDQFQLVKLAQL